MESNQSSEDCNNEDEASSSSFDAKADYHASRESEADLDVDLLETPSSAVSLQNEDERNPESGSNINDQLDEFRKKWHNELQAPADQSPPSHKEPLSESERLEEQAKAYYLQGMELEENHMLMEAIYYYKKALHMVPDIEAKLAPLFTQSPRDRVRQESESSLEGSEIDENLVIHFENLCVEDKSLCHPAYEQRATHISTLPVELLMYIFQWVVSPDLDLRNLENLSQVCRGFFLCSRDEQIWKIACDRMWGVNVGSAKRYGGSWRRMMIERPHPLFDGCYISRMTYVRQGEQNMDQFYRPCHIVQYFRYMRFFPDGTVMMLVSPEDPMQSLPKLRYKNSRASGLLVGGYQLMDSRITCVMKRVKTEQPSSNYRYKRQRRGVVQNETDISYFVDLEISPALKRQNAKLTWMKYTSCSFHKDTGEESFNEFELKKTSFPPMIFSHVASYCGPSTEPLA